MEENKKNKKIIIEELENGGHSFTCEGLSHFEILGLLTYYQKRMFVCMMQNQKKTNDLNQQTK